MSPYDHLEEIERPVLLGHGARDARVDIKHAVRLQRELEISGKPCLLVRFEEESAEISRDDNQAFFYEEVVRFFRENLQPPTDQTAGGE